jgi:hypothetical protein
MAGKAELVRVDGPSPGLPPLMTGRHTAAVEAQVRDFSQSVAQIFERWVTRRSSAHTRRAYRQDVISFVEFLGICWPEDATPDTSEPLANINQPGPGGLSTS